MHDLVIRGGKVVDGTGRPPIDGDVAVDGDRIVAVGAVEGRGGREIEADGAVVAPGWVDVHTHYDGQITWDPEVTPSGHNGVTTVVVGNCGVGFAPVREAERDWLIQLMEGVEDIPGTALAEGITWNWESFPEYLDEVERQPRVLDVAAMVPHGALRAYVLGCERTNDDATGDEIALMVKLAREAIEAGAVGVSTTRTVAHQAKDGQPAAGTFAKAEELLAIGSALAGAGRRVFSMASENVFGPKADDEFAWMAEASEGEDDRGLIDRLPEPSHLTAWLSAAELDHYIAEFTRTGFTGGPDGFMDEWVSDLRGKLYVDGAGHWVQQEKPAEVNAALVEFLDAVTP